MFDFETLVDRRGTESLKGNMAPAWVQEKQLANFWGAEFDFPTCPAFSEGVMECAKRGLYAFTLQGEQYNTRVQWWMKHVRNWDIETDWIVPMHGTIFSLASLLRLLVGPSQHMLVLTPGYNRYKQAADRMGKETRLCAMRYDREHLRYTLDWEKLEKAMADPDCTLLVFSQPNNPTGQALGAEDIRRLDAMSRKHEVVVFCDEIFGELGLTAPVVPYLSVVDADTLCVCSTSLGKCMSLTGVNHANLIIPRRELRERVIHQKYADHYGSLDPMLHAGLMRAFTEEGKAWLEALLTVLRENAQVLRSGIESLFPGAQMLPPQGGFVAFADFTRCALSDEALQARLSNACLMGDCGSEYHTSAQFYRYAFAMPLWQIQRTLQYAAMVEKRETVTGGERE